MKLQAFHNKPEEKQFFVDRLKSHRDAEHLVQGKGWESNGQIHGCNIGCLFEKYDHTLAPELIGLPEWLMWLCDFLFERLPPREANSFAIDWVEAIPVGADIEPVRYYLAVWRIEKSLELLLNNKEVYADECRNALNLVKAWHSTQINGITEAARSAARSAWSAARSAAWSAARSAARSAESAESAWSAARSAELTYVKEEATALINLLKQAK